MINSPNLLTGVDTYRLTLDEVRALNKQLAADGLRICTHHRGEPLPLTEDYFYKVEEKYFMHCCRTCHHQRNREQKLNRARARKGWTEDREVTNRRHLSNIEGRKRWANVLIDALTEFRDTFDPGGYGDDLRARLSDLEEVVYFWANRPMPTKSEGKPNE